MGLSSQSLQKFLSSVIPTLSIPQIFNICGKSNIPRSMTSLQQQVYEDPDCNLCEAEPFEQSPTRSKLWYL